MHLRAKNKAMKNLVDIESDPTTISRIAETIFTVLELMAAIAFYSAEWYWASGLLAGLSLATCGSA